MIHKIREEDGNTVHELDAEAIDYLIDGLRTLRDCQPGTELSTPSLTNNGVACFILIRAPDDV